MVNNVSEVWYKWAHTFEKASHCTFYFRRFYNGTTHNCSLCASGALCLHQGRRGVSSNGRCERDVKTLVTAVGVVSKASGNHMELKGDGNCHCFSQETGFKHSTFSPHFHFPLAQFATIYISISEPFISKSKFCYLNLPTRRQMCGQLKRRKILEAASAFWIRFSYTLNGARLKVNTWMNELCLYHFHSFPFPFLTSVICGHFHFRKWKFFNP